MGDYIIEYDRKGCIGAGVCVAFSKKHWVMNNDGKADLVDSKENGGIWTKEIDEKDLDENKSAAEGCPAQVIIIKKNGQKISP